MPVEVTYQVPVDLPENKIQQISETVFRGERFSWDKTVSFVFVDLGLMTEINESYFNRNESTDVISFLYNDDLSTEESESPWGEIYICVDRAREQAIDYQVTLQNEMARLIIHGLLHLIGYTDETAENEQRMTELENRYLKQIDPV